MMFIGFLGPGLKIAPQVEVRWKVMPKDDLVEWLNSSLCDNREAA